jgi:twitching motility two-component system response regulator PilG
MLQKISLNRVLTQAAPPGGPVIQDKLGLDPFSSQMTSRINPWIPSYSSPIIQPHLLQASQKFILVIDDSMVVCKILEACLSREGFQVKSFPDGLAAMRWLTEPQADTPDLIWLDISLPKMDGYEVARHLKAKPRFSHTVIVMLSRRDGVIDRLKGRLAGARDYLTKPFKTQDVVSVTRFYLGLAPSEQETLHQPSIALA